MGLMSRRKGKAGEREFAAFLREAWGIEGARRGVQFRGGPESPDVVGIFGVHIEVKRAERIDWYGALKQAKRDGKGKAAVVAGRRNDEEWNIFISAKDLPRFAARLLDAQMKRGGDDSGTPESD